MSSSVHIAAGSGKLKHAAISVSAIGLNEVVAGVTGKYLVVLAYVLVASGGINSVNWFAAGSGLSGPMDFVADAKLVCPWNPFGWLKTINPGQALNLNLTAATLVAGHLTYLVTDIRRPG